MPMRLIKIRQKFSCPQIQNIETHIKAEVYRTNLPLKPGARIAIAVGSRGISHLVPIVKTLVGILQALEARPFIVPAMGSHGGATDKGQANVLKGFGITERD